MADDEVPVHDVTGVHPPMQAGTAASHRQPDVPPGGGGRVERHRTSRGVRDVTARRDVPTASRQSIAEGRAEGLPGGRVAAEDAALKDPRQAEVVYGSMLAVSGLGSD